MKTLIPRKLLFSCKTYLIGNENKSRKKYREGVTPRDPIYTKMSPKVIFPLFWYVTLKNGYFNHIFSMKTTWYGAKSISRKISWEGVTPRDPTCTTCTKMSPKTSFFLVCLYYVINFFFLLRNRYFPGKYVHCDSNWVFKIFPDAYLVTFWGLYTPPWFSQYGYRKDGYVRPM